jgi:CDP-diacylglycerol---serine O-phosphatidyltransferase
LTCCNLLCGCLAIIEALQGQLFHTGYFVAAALVFDFFDGFAARKLGVASPIGRDLDSLADMVTFGVVPGMVMFMLLGFAEFRAEWPLDAEGHPALVQYVALVIPVFSALRLARFNNDTRQSDSFHGLPTPANAMVICSLPFIILGSDNAYELGQSWLLNPLILCALSVFMSVLLVSDLPLFALKFSDFSWEHNRLRYLFLIIAVGILAIFGISGVPAVILVYVLLSLLNNIFSRKRV